MPDTSIAQMQHALVIEDQNLMRMALIHELQSAMPASVIHGAANMNIALSLIADHQFDFIVIDPGLPDFDPNSLSDRYEVVRRIVDASPEAIHCVVTGSDTQGEWEHCKMLGVTAYLAKNNINTGALSEVLGEISEHGECVRFAKDMISISEFYHSSLTRREQEILDWMRQKPPQITRREIYAQLALRLGIDATSAERHYKRARAKVLKTGLIPNDL